MTVSYELDRELGIVECRRLLKSGCHLVMHETTRWLDGIRGPLAGHGFSIRAVHELPTHFWLTHWAVPLDARLREVERVYDVETLDDVTAGALATHRAAVASIRADPDAASCVYWIVRRN